MKPPVIDESFFPIITKKEQNLPFYISSIGKCAEQNHTIRKDGQPSHQLLYTSKGSGIAYFHNIEHPIEKGSLYFCPANSAHEYYPKDEPWETYWITFNGTAFNNFFNYTQGIWTPTSGFDFIKEYRKIYKMKNNTDWIRESGAALYVFLFKCLEVAPESSESLSLRHKLSGAIEYIENNYFNDIEIRFLAKLSGMSFEHFCRIFKAYTGIRPVEYITAMRINKSKEKLLKNSSMPISEISKLSGFESASYFTKIFKKSEGITPSDFRTMYSI